MKHKGYYTTDAEGFCRPTCSCGWSGNVCSDEDIALSEWTDHMEASAVSEEKDAT